MAKIIGIGNQKGGTGKTTSAINISSYLALAGKKTLLVDVDPQGNASSGTGLEIENKNSIYEVILGQKSASESIYSTTWPNLWVLPSSISLTGAEIELVNLDNRELRLKQALEILRSDFDYIIIDAPPSLGLLTLNVMAAANSLIIPVQCEYYALEGISKIVQTIDLVKERLSSSLEIEGVLLTMADFRTRLTLQVIDEVRKFFGPKAFNTIIPRNVKLAEAPSFGKPIHFYDSQSSGAKAYLNLTEELLKEKINLDIQESSMTKQVDNSEIVSVG
jgi:chromosome partitioning protein